MSGIRFKKSEDDEVLSMKMKSVLWCFLFYKEDVTLLQGALKKLLTSPVIMKLFI